MEDDVVQTFGQPHVHCSKCLNIADEGKGKLAGGLKSTT
jgi:hypothetical protein